MKTPSSQSGFTLMEMLILMVIIAVLAAMALPGADDYVADNRMNAAMSDLIGAMQTARSEAVGRNSPVSLCAASKYNENSCFTGAASYHDGWYIFVDSNSDGVIDSGEEILQMHESIGAEVGMEGTSDLKKPLTFFPSGRTSISSTQTLIICDERGFGDDAKGVVVSILGRASAYKATATTATSCFP